MWGSREKLFGQSTWEFILPSPFLLQELIRVWCYIVFYFVFWHISTLKTCIMWHSINVLNFPFPALSSWEALEENEEEKNCIRRSRNSGKESKNKRGERGTGCLILKERWIECSKEAGKNTGASFRLSRSIWLYEDSFIQTNETDVTHVVFDFTSDLSGFVWNN